MEFIIIFVLMIVVTLLFQGTKGVNYLLTLKKILKEEYGWTQSEFDEMWSYHQSELNQLKQDGQSTRQIAEHIDQYLNHYKSAFE
jgi:hypothetical protein|tara:strand:- start:81 stop:335 length:255 start_codon:yes stop_codon:yes gene_type:complete